MPDSVVNLMLVGLADLLAAWRYNRGMGKEPFALTLPSFVLAKNFTPLPNGAVKWGGETIFLTPQISDTESAFAVFTDEDLARQCLEDGAGREGYMAFAIPDAQKLLELLKLIAPQYHQIAIDLNLKTHEVRLLPTQHMIEGIIARLRERGQ